MARLRATVVLPSPGAADTTSSARMSRSMLSAQVSPEQTEDLDFPCWERRGCTGAGVRADAERRALRHHADKRHAVHLLEIARLADAAVQADEDERQSEAQQEAQRGADQRVAADLGRGRSVRNSRRLLLLDVARLQLGEDVQRGGTVLEGGTRGASSQRGGKRLILEVDGPQRARVVAPAGLLVVGDDLLDVGVGDLGRHRRCPPRRRDLGQAGVADLGHRYRVGHLSGRGAVADDPCGFDGDPRKTRQPQIGVGFGLRVGRVDDLEPGCLLIECGAAEQHL